MLPCMEQIKHLQYVGYSEMIYRRVLFFISSYYLFYAVQNGNL